MILRVHRKRYRRTKICASAKWGSRTSRLAFGSLTISRPLGQRRDSQLCVPASQQVCLYRCNRKTEKSEVCNQPGTIRHLKICFVKIKFCLQFDVPKRLTQRPDAPERYRRRWTKQSIIVRSSHMFSVCVPRRSRRHCGKIFAISCSTYSSVVRRTIRLIVMP